MQAKEQMKEENVLGGKKNRTIVKKCFVCIKKPLKGNSE